MAAVLVLGAAAVPAAAASRYNPRLRFRTIRTLHFDVHAHQGEEAQAAQLAALAERVRREFEPVLGVPRGRVHVILVDQTDVANGWASPTPRDTIEITAAPPSPDDLIGNTTDWLELVFTHEYTHILHLDRTRGFMEGVRRILGRAPAAFPNLFLPTWQLEGLATFEESRMTGAGRVPAGDFRAIVDTAAASRRFDPVDRAGGGLDDWPGGQAPYAYGAYFHEFLADRYGVDRLAKLADATAGRVPFFGAGAFKAVFGESIEQAWGAFRDARENVARRAGETDQRASRLTHDGFVVTAPGVATDGSIYYAVANPDGFPELRRRLPDGRTVRTAWRALGNRTSVRGDWIVFDQLERVRSTATYSDLYAVRTSGGTVARLTKQARAADPDLSPDGRRIVCTVQVGGRRALALLEFAPERLVQPRALAGQADADYTGPVWSPDGHWIVAERRQDDRHELALVDPEAGTSTTLLSSSARLVTPSWTPDGAAVLFAADFNGEPFNVYAIDLATRHLRQVTDTASGARFPTLSRDGVLTFVGYTSDGFDLFSVPTAQESWRPFAAPTPRHAQSPLPAVPVSARPYSPLATLMPTYWTPIVVTDAGETLVGGGTAMTDVLGRHAYAADAEWSASRARPDWHVAYAYDRWRPTLVASYADDTDPIQGGDVRSRELFAGVLLPFRRVRWTETLLAGIDAESDRATCASCGAAGTRALRSVRGGWLHDSRRAFGYSIGVDEGFMVEAAAEASRTALGSDADAGSAIFDARGYQRVFSRHTVLAARLAAAASWGAPAGRRRFSAAGSGPASAAFDFGRDTIGLMRGLAPASVAGFRAAVVNVDLRAPLRRVERGAGTWPVFVRSAHGALFADAGEAWDRTFRAGAIRTSVGGELAVDLVLGHTLPLTVASGIAWTRDPVAGTRGAAVFGRLGHAF